MSLLALVGVHFAGRGLPTLQRIEAQLASAQESLWKQKVRNNPGLDDRRHLYREEVTTAIEQYQADSRKYRRIHNSLQTLIMIGSASTTTIAALDTGKELTWQSVTLTVISFAITVAAMFTGYYKFRERAWAMRPSARCASASLRQLEFAGQRAGMTGCRRTHAGRGRLSEE